MTRDRRRTTGDEGPKPGQEAAPPDKHICCYCAYAHWMRMGPSVLMAMDWMKHLICTNHPDAPGEFREVLGNGTCPNFLARREPGVRTQPPAPPNDKVKYIALTQGQHAIVDAADFERLNKHKWHAVPNTSSGHYAARHESGRTILMHREIMNAPDDMVVDHVNRYASDNRQNNLRLCTPQQNMCNRRVPSRSSQYQGVHPMKNRDKWGAFITVQGHYEHVGSFDTEVEAAQVRDRWAFALHGRFAYLNFPDDFVGKDPADPEFQTLCDQLAEKRRKREARRKAREDKSKKEKGKSKKASKARKEAKDKGRKPKPNRQARKNGKPENGGQTTEDRGRGTY